MRGDRENGQGKRLAVRVLEACRNQLFFRYRYLETALFRLVWKESEDIFFGSEGEYLYYNYKYVLNRYMEGTGLAVLDYLHTMMHCLYLHPFLHSGKEFKHWNLAADIAVECTLEEMMRGDGENGIAENPSAERNPGKKEQAVPGGQGQICRSEIIESLKAEIKIMSAQKIYAYLEKNAVFGRRICGVDFAVLCALFQRDDHSLWHGVGRFGETKGTSGEEGNGPGEGLRFGPWRKSESCGYKKEMQQRWKEAAGRVLMESKIFSQPEKGEIAGNLLRNLGMLTRKNHEYTEFLNKFAGRPEEQLRLDEEFDYVFYTYGLKLFGKVPLIEPLEYREKYVIREFIIAIDTSGSCQGELVRRFLSKTYEILHQKESFAAKVNIHILQCDTAVLEDVKIESPGDLEKYIARMTLKGFGGTDFCPVFEYADRLMETGDMKKAEGLLYFTDGYGRFPSRPPEYKTAFVFLDQEEDVKVPAWAMKVYLDVDELETAKWCCPGRKEPEFV